MDAHLGAVDTIFHSGMMGGVKGDVEMGIRDGYLERTAKLAKEDMFLRRAEAGAYFLDKRVHGWRKRIDLRRLDLASHTQDILGQLFGSYERGFCGLKLTVADDTNLGFSVSMHDGPPEGRVEDYRILTDKWKSLLSPVPNGVVSVG